MKLEQLLLGESDAIVRLRKELPRIAGRKDNLLITGEAGTGKTTIARLIHHLSGARNPMVEINPSGLTDQVFRDAVESLRDSSILFVPNAQELSFLHQAMLAAALGSRGARKSPRAMVTLGAPVDDLLADKRLLKELAEILGDYQVIEVPPLSRRTGDIPLLIDAFMRNACIGTNMNLKTIDINILDFLTRRTWKGNVKELKAVVERAVMESRGEEIELPSELVDEATQLEGILSNIGDKKRFAFDKALSNLEKTLIERTLALVSFNQSHAADILNLSEANLRYRMKKFKIKG